MDEVLLEEGVERARRGRRRRARTCSTSSSTSWRRASTSARARGRALAAPRRSSARVKVKSPIERDLLLRRIARAPRRARGDAPAPRARAARRRCRAGGRPAGAGSPRARRRRRRRRRRGRAPPRRRAVDARARPLDEQERLLAGACSSARGLRRRCVGRSRSEEFAAPRARGAITPCSRFADGGARRTVATVLARASRPTPAAASRRWPGCPTTCRFEDWVPDAPRDTGAAARAEPTSVRATQAAPVAESAQARLRRLVEAGRPRPGRRQRRDRAAP